MSTSKDSRRDPRAKILSLTVRYKSATVAEFVENHSYDVSRGGLFIRTGAPFPTGTLIKFEVRIAEEQSVMTGVGRVTWRREKDKGEDNPAGMGVKFIKIDDNSAGLIDKLVNSRPAAASSFEEGAREQGVPLSDPPAELRTGSEDRISSRPPPAGEMLDQSSALLKSTIGSLSSARLKDRFSDTEEERLTLPTGTSANFKAAASPPAATAPNHAPVTPAPREVQAQFALNDEAELSPPSSDRAGEASENSPSEDGSAEERQSDERRSEERRSKGKKKPKKEKKRKKKFRYANIPVPKQVLPHTVSPSGESLSLTTVTTTPPRKRKTEAPPRAPNNTVWVVLAAIVLALGLYWINRSDDADEPAASDAAAPSAQLNPSSRVPAAAGAPAAQTAASKPEPRPPEVSPSVASAALQPTDLPKAEDVEVEAAEATDTAADNDSTEASEPTTKRPRRVRPGRAARSRAAAEPEVGETTSAPVVQTDSPSTPTTVTPEQAPTAGPSPAAPSSGGAAPAQSPAQPPVNLVSPSPPSTPAKASPPQAPAVEKPAASSAPPASP